MSNHSPLSNQSEDRQSLLLRLKETQRESGYLSDEGMRELAESLGVTVSEVYGVATFYSFLATGPRGRNVIRACKSLPCCLKDSQMIVSSIEDAIGIGVGGTTPDGRFSFELVNCIGACDNAPAILINDDLHAGLSPSKISEILKEYE